MFRVITLNVNGIRSATRKGFVAWLLEQNADVICLQELKAQADVLQDPKYLLEGYEGYFHFAEKKGYSGVGIYTRHKPKSVLKGLGFETADREGRYVAIDLGQFWVASIYFPSGTSGVERQTIKYEFLDHFGKYLQKLRENAHEFIMCGDWNIAHQNIDLKNWRGNQKNSGFLPEERAWLNTVFDEMGFVDAFRVISQEPEQYTWWSNRGQAWHKNVGWRIDYQIVSPKLKPCIKSASIFKDERFSDHAPLIMDYDILI